MKVIAICNESVYNCGWKRMNPRTILVVEDDSNDEKLTLRALRGINSPCTVVVARSGIEALYFLFRQGEFAERRSPDPAMIFLDNTLPGVPGNELVRRIRSDESLRSVPLVVFSGSSDENLVRKCLDAGANAFIEKPIDMGDYLAALRASAEQWLQ